MDPRDYWNAYINRCGGVPALAESSGIPYPTLASVTNGQRGIGRKLAAQLTEHDPLLDKGLLLQIGPIRSEAA